MRGEAATCEISVLPKEKKSWRNIEWFLFLFAGKSETFPLPPKIMNSRQP